MFTTKYFLLYSLMDEKRQNTYDPTLKQFIRPKKKGFKHERVRIK